MKNTWYKNGASYHIRETSNQVRSLPVGIYKTMLDAQTGEIYLDQTDHVYSFPYKVYGMQDKFIKQVAGTYQATSGNLGILLNGIKGTGKTVCSKQLANEFINFGLPVILVTSALKGLPSFINDLQQDVVLFIDEYEKIFDEKEHSILSVMDGALDNGHRKVWLLTTNQKYISQYMLDRPGRIRYVKNFSHMDAATIEEIVVDMLQKPEFKDDIIHYLSTLETLSIDLVKAIVEEVNIHGIAPKEFASFFNASVLEQKAHVFMLKKGETQETLWRRNATVSHYQFTEENIEEEFDANGSYVGDIEKVINETTVIVNTFRNDPEGNEIKFQIRVEPIDAYHQSYSKYPLTAVL